MRGCAPSTTSSTRETDDASTQDSCDRRWPLVALVAVARCCRPATRRTGAAARIRRCAARFTFIPNRSDGSGTVDAIAAAAARAGLQFIILTDHGDGTRSPDAAGVSQRRADDRRRRAQHHRRPLRRARAAGGAVSARRHARGRHRGCASARRIRDSPRIRIAAAVAELAGLGRRRSTASSGSTPTASGATSRACRSRARSLTYLAARRRNRWRRCSIGPTSVLRQWDELAATRQVVGLAGADAHARLGLQPAHRSRRRGDSRAVAGLRVVVPRVLESRRARRRRCRATRPRMPAALIDAIRSGRVYSVIDALATPGSLTFSATSGSTIGAARREPRDRRRRVAARSASAPPGTTLVLLRDGQRVHEVDRRPARDQRRQGARRVSRRGLHARMRPAGRRCRGSSRIRSTSGSRQPRVAGDVPEPRSRIPARAGEAAAEFGPRTRASSSQAR